MDLGYDFWANEGSIEVREEQVEGSYAGLGFELGNQRVLQPWTVFLDEGGIRRISWIGVRVVRLKVIVKADDLVAKVTQCSEKVRPPDY